MQLVLAGRLGEKVHAVMFLLFERSDPVVRPTPCTLWTMRVPFQNKVEVAVIAIGVPHDAAGVNLLPPRPSLDDNRLLKS